MRVMLKLVLDCEPDGAWRAIRSPDVLRAVSAPLMRFTPLTSDGGWPAQWPEGEHPARVSAAGVVPLGEQVIRIGYPDAPEPGVRMLRDSGYGRSGVFTLVREWEHTMAVSEAPGGGTLYRDRLRFDAGPLTPLMWPMYWAFWQWRAWRMRRLSLSW